MQVIARSQVLANTTRRALVSFQQAGAAATPEFRLFAEDGGAKVSPWHDIALSSSEGSFNMLTEIPRFTLPKMEVSTKEEFNPIAQDIKKGKLRDYHGPLFWNYGCLPQTWEDPNVMNHEVGCVGDNDPLDVVEIGSNTLAMGSISQVKPLGVFSMIDDGELDWKLVAINVQDELAEQLNSIADVERLCPGTISGIREWFRWYKTPDGKPINGFGHNEELLDSAKALEVIEETHEFWQNLRAGKTDPGKLWLGN